MDLAERLSEYIDGELPQGLRREVIEHFSDCSRCVTFLESLKRTRDLGAFLPEVRLSAEALDRLTRNARRHLEG
jgi:anti-sigma factor RsiW